VQVTTSTTFTLSATNASGTRSQAVQVIASGQMDGGFPEPAGHFVDRIDHGEGYHSFTPTLKFTAAP